MGGKQLPIGKRLASLRQARKITQSELAAHLHISYQSVSKWETGAAYPDIGLLPHIAQYFGVSTDYLLGLDERSVLTKRFFLVADQGGTKTQVLLCDFEGKICDEIRTGGACWFYVGIDKSMNYIGEAVDTLIARNKIDSEEIAFIVCGAAGINWDDERGMFTQALERRVNLKAFVYNDCGAAVYCDGLNYPNRVLLCAGTEFGASVVTETMPDPFVYCNQIQLQPQVLGATAIGTAAVKAVLLAGEELGEQTALKDAVLSYYETPDISALLSAYVRKTTVREPKGLAPIVFDIARKGDKVATEILLQYAADMTNYAVAAIKHYGLGEKKTAILLAGGVFMNEFAPFYQKIEEIVKSVCPQAEIIRTQKEPVYGAYEIGMMKIRQMLKKGELA